MSHFALGSAAEHFSCEAGVEVLSFQGRAERLLGFRLPASGLRLPNQKGSPISALALPTGRGCPLGT
jgi:hypothetical protein